MKMEELRIVFMGTPEFALPSLEKLLAAGCHVVAVITAPDKPAGRGKKVRASAVKSFALQQQLNLLQPTNLKNPVFVSKLAGLKPDLAVVVAFRMLPEVVWRMPKMGTLNLHASLLPHYRGAAPIHHVLINGESTTGVTTFMIDEKIDTGKILLQEQTPIGPEETAGELHDRLMQMGAELVVETIRQLAEGKIEPRTQDELVADVETLKRAPKIGREDCRIDWQRSGTEIHNLIRGLSPYPGAYTYLQRREESADGGERILCKILSSVFEQGAHTDAPGSIRMEGGKELLVAVKDGFILPRSIQQEGKRVMETEDFLRGFSLSSYQPRFF